MKNIELLIQNLIRLLFPHRYMASILLIILIDYATYLAFTQSQGMISFQYKDKINHMVGFFVLTGLGYVSLHYDFVPKLKKTSFGLLAVNAFIWMGYGVFIEFVQSFLSYRSATVGDLIADLIGIILASTTVVVFKMHPRSPREHHQSQTQEEH